MALNASKFVPGRLELWKRDKKTSLLSTSDINEAASFITHMMANIKNSTCFFFVGAGISTSRGLMVHSP
jgi:hypothetical protein